MHMNTELIPGVKSGDYIKIKSGSIIYTSKGKNSQQTAKKEYVVKLYRYVAGIYVSAYMAMNEPWVRTKLESQKFNFDMLVELEELDINAYYSSHNLELKKPSVRWVGSGGYWYETAIDNVTKV